MEKLRRLYEEYLNRFTHIKDLNKQKEIGDILETLHKKVDRGNLYFYDLLYSSYSYEQYCMQGSDKVEKDFKVIMHNNYNELMNGFSYLLDIPKKEHFNRKTLLDDEDEIISTFFLSLDKDLYELYNRLKPMTFRVFEDGTGQTSYDSEKDRTMVFAGREHTVESMIALVHELGHAYYVDTFKETRNAYDCYDMLKREIPSETLELLFIKYLIDNDLYSEDAINRLNEFNNTILNDATKFYENKMFLNETDHGQIRDMKYLLGSIMSYDFLNNNISFRDLLYYVHNSDVSSIIKNIDYKTVSENINKSYCLKKQ